VDILYPKVRQFAAVVMHILHSLASNKIQQGIDHWSAVNDVTMGVAWLLQEWT